MNIKIPETNIIYFIRKLTASILTDILISCVLIVYKKLLDTELYFHSHVELIPCHDLDWLGIIRFIAYDLYTALIRQNLENVSIAGNNLTLTN
jgi:hypothetical protein